MTRSRILLTGGSGQVGWELRRALAPLAQVVAPPRAELDLRDAASLRRAVRALRPAAIVNAAADTAVDAAESAPDAAHAVNAAAPGVLAEEAARLGALLVHFSTDYVFDGRSASPYREDDAPAPLNVYGATKLAGERAVAAAGGAHLVFRVGWIYGARGRNFARTVLARARAGQALRVVDDQRGAPTWSRMAAEAVALVLARLRAGEGFTVDPAAAGVYHLGSGGEATWHGFARALLDADPAAAAATLEAVSTDERPGTARRPACTLLDSARAEAAFGVRLPEWREQLGLCREADPL